MEQEMKEKLPGLMLLSFSTFVVCVPAAFTQIISFDLMFDLNSFPTKEYSWAFPLFVAGECSTMALSAGLIDRYGRRKPFMIASIVFVAATCACAHSHQMAWFNLFRLFQGMGAGVIIVTCIAQIYFDIKDKKLRYMANGVMSLGFGVGMLTGLFVSKAVAGSLGWTTAFWFLAALQAVLMFPAMQVLKNGKNSEMKADIPGALTLAVLAGAFVLFLQNYYLYWNIHDISCIAAICVLVTLFIGFVFLEMVNPNSMFHRRVDSGKLVSGSMIFIILLGTFAMGAVGYMVKTAFFTYQMSVYEAAPFFTLMVLGAAVTAVTISKTIDRTGHLIWLLLSVLLTPLALLSMLLVKPDDPSFLFAAHLFLLGLGIGCLVSMLNATIQNRSNKDNNGALISFAIMARTMSLWLGFNFFLLYTDMHMSEKIGSTIAYWNDVLGLELPSTTILANMMLTPLGDLVRLLPGLTDEISDIFAEGVGIGFTYAAIAFVVIGLPAALLLVGRRKMI